MVPPAHSPARACTTVASPPSAPAPTKASGPIRAYGPITAPDSITASAPIVAVGATLASLATTADGAMPGTASVGGWNRESDTINPFRGSVTRKSGPCRAETDGPAPNEPCAQVPVLSANG